MRKLTLSLIAGAAALAVGGTAMAQQEHAPRPPMTRAAAEQRAAQMFDRLDANHDGKLDQADRAAMQKARFDRMDANHDGQLSFAEFTSMQGRGGEHGQQGAERGRRGEHARGGFAERGGMMRLADADKNGTITKAEFQAAALARFDRLDANKDGTVTPDEAKAARDSMRQQWQSRRQGQQSS
ncbi:MAG: EF-hand domain-containing protein [Croceibacterium sp.]